MVEHQTLKEGSLIGTLPAGVWEMRMTSFGFVVFACPDHAPRYLDPMSGQLKVLKPAG